MWVGAHWTDWTFNWGKDHHWHFHLYHLEKLAVAEHTIFQPSMPLSPKGSIPFLSKILYWSSACIVFVLPMLLHTSCHCTVSAPKFIRNQRSHTHTHICARKSFLGITRHSQILNTGNKTFIRQCQIVIREHTHTHSRSSKIFTDQYTDTPFQYFTPRRSDQYLVMGLPSYSI